MSLRPTPYPDSGITRALAQRWCSLAETRLNYLTELFESGRWRRFHTEAEFLDNIQEAKAAVERWRLMVDDRAAAPRSLLSSPGTVLYQAPAKPRPRPSMPPMVAPAPLEIAAPRAAEVPVIASPELIPIEILLQQAPPRKTVVTPEDLNWQRALDPVAIGDRYPMLRTAM
jgi:uncharacterized repeat protein (TIGR03809 family)